MGISYIFCRNNIKFEEITKSNKLKPEIINNTITTNRAENKGGGIYTNNIVPLVMNSILWSNSAALGTQYYTLNEKSNLIYCNVQDTIWSGEGNIYCKPLFTDSLKNLDDSCRCIGAGKDKLKSGDKWYYAPVLDYNDDFRPLPVGSNPDIGAQENMLNNPLSNIIDNEHISEKFELLQNYPNPFNPRTNIQFSIPKTAFIRLKIFNLLGQEVDIIVSGMLEKGTHQFIWDASQFASGVYFYRLETDQRIISTKTLILLK